MVAIALLSSFTHLLCLLLPPTQAAKMTNADSDKNRKRKEHQKRILAQQGGKPSGSDGKPSSKDDAKSSAFQELFTQRAQGFQIDFRFRNAPPRPPVGPTWVDTVDTSPARCSRQYQPSPKFGGSHYKWKLHTESDLYPSTTAMDLKSYDEAAVVKDIERTASLHPDDAALLNGRDPWEIRLPIT
jgi:RNA polymerase II-associated factor 1